MIHPAGTFVVLAVLFGSVPVFAQTAQITGRVQDPSALAIAGATLSVRNLDTGIVREVKTNDEGYFTASALVPGSYEVRAVGAGFKPMVRTGVKLDEGQTLRLDFSLVLGDVKESVEVSAEGQLLDRSSVTVSTVITNEKIVQLPLLNRNIISLATLTPMVRPVGSFGGLPVSSFDGSRMSIAGGGPSSNNLQIDGIAAENMTSGVLNMFLSVDATAEFRVITRNPSAEYGRTGGGVVTMISKSGTNEFHGSLYEFHRNKVLNANNWFANRTGRPRGPFVLNQFGATLGGPIRKRQTFFFGNFEGFEFRETQQAFRTVSTDLQRAGDFRGTLDPQDRQINIYDPLTTRPNPAGGFTRDIISCNGVQNVICPNRISPVATSLLEFVPRANLPGIGGTGQNNYFGQTSVPQSKRIYGGKVDHNFNSLRRLSGRYTYDSSMRGFPDFYQTIAEPNESNAQLRRDSVAVNYTDTLSPTRVLEARAGVNRYGIKRTSRSFGFDLASVGFSADLARQIQMPQFPRITISDMTAFGSGQGDTFDQGSYAYTFGAAVTEVAGAHALKYGGENRIYQLNNTQRSVPVMDLNFSRAFTQGPNPNTAAANVGHGLATFLLGTPTAGTAAISATSTYTLKHYAFFLQDDWKITPKLTLNLGMRWEYEGPLTDRFNAITNFDPNRSFAANGVNPRGGLIFPGSNGIPRGHRDVSLNDWQPRFGFAYQLFPKTVIRGGYGIYFLPTTGIFVTLGRTGYDQATPLVATDAAIAGGFRPIVALANPFPNGLIRPLGPEGGATSGIGTAASANLRSLKRGYSQQYNFNVQHELPGAILLELGYSANKGTSLPVARDFDYLPFSVRRANTVAQLQAAVPNPYCGLVQPGLICNARVQASALLDTYPQFNNAAGLDSWASSTYHAFTVKAERRFSRGLSLLVSYTLSKLIDDSIGNGTNIFTDGGNNAVQDWDNLQLERAVSSLNQPQRLVSTVVYNLPFAKQGSGWKRRAFGDWQVNGILTLQSGNPIGVTTAVGNRPFAGIRPNLVGDPKPAQQTIDNWINPAAFTLADERNPGNAPRNLPSLRSDSLVNLDMALLKNLAITERWLLQFRAEAINLTNTPSFGLPGTGFGSAAFGVVTSTVNSPRNIQLALKLLF